VTDLNRNHARIKCSTDPMEQCIHTFIIQLTEGQTDGHNN